MFQELETDRLILREITSEDVHDIFGIFASEEVTRFYGQDPLDTLEQAQVLIEFFTKNLKEKRGIRWGMERKGNKGLIGTIGFNNWSIKHRRAEIGYELSPSYWRKGFATEAILKVVEYGFTELEMNRIGAVVVTENTSSNEVLKKLGFKQEGLLEQYIYQNGHPQDTYMYGLLKR